MDTNIKKFRDGIFSLYTRRFGTVAELMIASLYNLDESLDQFHDRYDNVNKQKVEIKFSTVRKSNTGSITSKNVIQSCIDANIQNREFNSTDIHTCNFDCNIQQIKTSEFDILYYGLFFADKIAIFSMTSDEVKNCKGYSDKQHKGNIGEGQFHLNRDSIDYHLKNNIKQWLSYEELYNIFCKNQ